ncbi:MAG: biopolymer transporter ExbD [Alphaproteobacteria bacterium]|nr:biopolymer transporter ExbD [Alphaproteobacteria bacterium]
MAFGGFQQGDDPRLMAEINMIPLIDVMLVLLVIFIITAPLLTHAVKVDLPKARSAPNITRPDNVQLALDAQGRIWWNGEEIGDAALEARMRDAARRDPQPELHLRADGGLAYRNVARVMSKAASHGLVRIGFVTDPAEAP